MGVRAPVRIFAAVRAIAPVAGMPPAIGQRTFAIPLRHQLLVGIVARIGHAIGDHGGEKRFDCAQRGDGEGRPHQIAHRLESYGREMQTRQACGNAAEPAIDGCHRPAGEISDQRCRCHRDNACRHAPG